MSEAQVVVCPFCERGRPWRGRTDGFGGVIDETPPCNCDTARRKRGVCRDCESPVEGQVGKAVRCGQHKKEAAREACRRYRERHPKRVRAIQRRYDRKRKTPEGRARRRLYERERRKNDPRYREAKRRSRRKRSLAGKTAEEKRRYKERHPERVREQQRRANRKRAKAKREYMHRYATKYVGPGKSPTCGCGAAIPWSGRGRPMKKCEECDPTRWRHARQRWAKKVREGLADEIPPELREEAA